MSEQYYLESEQSRITNINQGNVIGKSSPVPGLDDSTSMQSQSRFQDYRQDNQVTDQSECVSSDSDQSLNTGHNPNEPLLLNLKWGQKQKRLQQSQELKVPGAQHNSHQAEQPKGAQHNSQQAEQPKGAQHNSQQAEQPKGAQHNSHQAQQPKKSLNMEHNPNEPLEINLKQGQNQKQLKQSQELNVEGVQHNNHQAEQPKNQEAQNQSQTDQLKLKGHPNQKKQGKEKNFSKVFLESEGNEIMKLTDVEFRKSIVFQLRRLTETYQTLDKTNKNLHLKLKQMQKTNQILNKNLKQMQKTNQILNENLKQVRRQLKKEMQRTNQTLDKNLNQVRGKLCQLKKEIQRPNQTLDKSLNQVRGKLSQLQKEIQKVQVSQAKWASQANKSEINLSIIQSANKQKINTSLICHPQSKCNTSLKQTIKSREELKTHSEGYVRHCQVELENHARVINDLELEPGQV